MSRHTPKRERRTPWTGLHALKWGFGALLLATVCNGCLLVLFGLSDGRRAPTRRTEALNDVKNLALATTNYWWPDHAMPPHGEPAGPPAVSWMTAILPQMDEAELYASIDFDRPFDHPANAAAFATRVSTYSSPHVRPTSMIGGLYPAHWAGNRPLFAAGGGFEAVPDGVSNTLLIGEVNAATGVPTAWGDPANLRTADGPLDSPTGFGGNGRGGFVAAMADGRAKFINDGIDPAVLAALGTPDGGETVDPADS